MSGSRSASAPACSWATDQRPTGTWAAALLHALARDEAAGRRAARLTEPGLATWNHFRGRLTATDLLALVFEDAAVLHRVPFDAAALGGPLQLPKLPAAVAAKWRIRPNTCVVKRTSWAATRAARRIDVHEE